MITLSPCIRTLGVLHTNPDTGVEYGIDYFAWVLSEASDNILQSDYWHKLLLRRLLRYGNRRITESTTQWRNKNA